MALATNDESCALNVAAAAGDGGGAAVSPLLAALALEALPSVPRVGGGAACACECECE